MHARKALPPAIPNDDHDSPWKDALELYFPQAVALLAPDLHAIIVGAAPAEFLDKVLQAVWRASAPAEGRRHDEKLSGDIQIQSLHQIEGRQVLLGDRRNGNVGDAHLILLDQMKQ